jgi:hypothetical protein
MRHIWNAPPNAIRRFPPRSCRTIWHSALKFFKTRWKGSDGYVPPDEYEDTFGTSFLKPDDYSDIGEAKVIAKECKKAPIHQRHGLHRLRRGPLV